MISWLSQILPATSKAVLGLTATAGTVSAAAAGWIVAQADALPLDVEKLGVLGSAGTIAIIAVRVAFKLMDRVDIAATSAENRADAAEARARLWLERATLAEDRVRDALDQAAESARNARAAESHARELAERLAEVEHHYQNLVAQYVEGTPPAGVPRLPRRHGQGHLPANTD